MRAALRFQFTLPLPPNRANARYGHWGVRSSLKRQYIEVAKATIAQRLFQVYRQPVGFLGLTLLTRARVTAEFWVPDRYDDDNVVSLCKWPLDALVKAGVLKDDKRPWCQLAGIPEQHVVRIRRRKGESDGDLLKRKLAAGYRVELTVEEIA